VPRFRRCLQFHQPERPSCRPRRRLNHHLHCSFPPLERPSPRSRIRLRRRLRPQAGRCTRMHRVQRRTARGRVIARGNRFLIAAAWKVPTITPFPPTRRVIAAPRARQFLQSWSIPLYWEKLGFLTL
jgi:hypothetical protein